jgi:hypothetical protein
VLGRWRLAIQNSDGGELILHELRFPLAPQATPQVIAARLEAVPGLRGEGDAFWNWLDTPAPPRPPKRSYDAENTGVCNVTMGDCKTLHGTIEIKNRALVVNVNSAPLAGRAIAMLRSVLDELVGAPMKQFQTIDQARAQKQHRTHPNPDIPLGIRTKLVHDALHRRYRIILDQPISALGDQTPRRAARTARV